jgi:hypothetical protein
LYEKIKNNRSGAPADGPGLKCGFLPKAATLAI